VTQDAAVAVGEQFLQVGGYPQGTTTTPLSSGYLYNPQTQSMKVLTGVASMNNPRASFQLVPLPDGTAMAIGGITGSGPDAPTVIVGAEVFVPN
jgi:hypothetical protein